MATHSSTLAWKIPWMVEPGRLQSMGSLRVGHDWATSLSLFTFMHWRRKWQLTPISFLGNPRDGGAWWAAVYGVTQSWTGLKWFSSSSSKKQINSWLGMMIGPGRSGRDRLLREEGSFESDGYVHFLDCSDGLINVYVFQTIKLYTLYLYSLLYINYTSIVYF